MVYSGGSGGSRYSCPWWCTLKAVNGVYVVCCCVVVCSWLLELNWNCCCAIGRLQCILGCISCAPAQRNHGRGFFGRGNCLCAGRLDRAAGCLALGSAEGCSCGFRRDLGRDERSGRHFWCGSCLWAGLSGRSVRRRAEPHRSSCFGNHSWRSGWHVRCGSCFGRIAQRNAERRNGGNVRRWFAVRATLRGCFSIELGGRLEKGSTKGPRRGHNRIESWTGSGRG